MLRLVNGGRSSETSPHKLLKSQRLLLGSYSMSTKSAPYGPTSVIAGVRVSESLAWEASNETIGGAKIRILSLFDTATSPYGPTAIAGAMARRGQSFKVRTGFEPAASG